MRLILSLVLVLFVMTIFALSNLEPVTVRFWNWTIWTAPLSLVLAGAGVLGALLTYLTSLIRHVYLARRIRDLEKKLTVPETQQMPAAGRGVEYLDKDNFPH
jgi:uncharacterized integral membrane protein